MDLFKAIAPKVMAEIEFVEVAGSSGGEQGSASTLPAMSWDNVVNKPWE